MLLLDWERATILFAGTKDPAVQPKRSVCCSRTRPAKAKVWNKTLVKLGVLRAQTLRVQST